MLKIDHLRLNSGRWTEDRRLHGRLAVAEDGLAISWSVSSDCPEKRFRVWVEARGGLVWDSGWMDDSPPLRCTFPKDTLPREVPLTVTVEAKNADGERASLQRSLILSGFSDKTAQWIVPPVSAGQRVLSFSKGFLLENRAVDRAVLYLCGVGCHQVRLNGREVDAARLDPAFSDYTKSCYYVMLPQLESHLMPGENCLSVDVAPGWRNNRGDYLRGVNDGREVCFMGEIALTALLKVFYTDGSVQSLSTDSSWEVRETPRTFSHLFDGETYDASHSCLSLGMAVPSAGPGGTLRLMEVEPVLEQQVLAPVWVGRMGPERFLVDFGQNIAGVCRLRLPQNCSRGQTIVLRHSEELDDEGELFTAPLRSAKAEDRYIASPENGENPAVWQPLFTYHGFRYAQITGLRELSAEDIGAVRLYTDAEQTGFFRCGSPVLNQIHQAVLDTERANMHSILTDCPQRDERMGWMNDATVRFEETPFNFDMGRFFPKVVQDLLDCQDSSGAITCTAPYVYGGRPADPVCSSFLLAVWESLLYYGDRALLERSYEGLRRWEDCLAAYAHDYILSLSYYGDWAGPVYACKEGDRSLDAVHSRWVPGELMSTGYFYYNAVLLERFARQLGREGEAASYKELQGRIQEAFLRRWWDPERCAVAGGSQGSQSFALWLDILPPEKRQPAADLLHRELERCGYRIATGNLNTRYLLDALTRYGYVDDAYRILTSEQYPSIGYMLQNGATTVWERFEQKTEPGMNSHCHPMYGSVDYWFYRYLAGIEITAPACTQVRIRPYFPRELLHVQCVLQTVQGPLSVRWNRRYGRLHLHVDIPDGVTALLEFGGEQRALSPGLHHFSQEADTADLHYLELYNAMGVWNSGS